MFMSSILHVFIFLYMFFVSSILQHIDLLEVLASKYFLYVFARKSIVHVFAPKDLFQVFASENTFPMILPDDIFQMAASRLLARWRRAQSVLQFCVVLSAPRRSSMVRKPRQEVSIYIYIYVYIYMK